MESKRQQDMTVGASVEARRGVEAGMVRSTHYRIEALRDGEVLWVEEFNNTVTNEGLNDSLDKHFKGSAYTASWFVGLTDGGPTVAVGDTLSSHAGWSEVDAYAGDRKALTLGSVSSQSVDNSNDRAEFAIDANDTTIGGAFVTTAETGTSGILYGGGAFTGDDKLLDNGDVLRVTVTLTAANPS